VTGVAYRRADAVLFERASFDAAFHLFAASLPYSHLASLPAGDKPVYEPRRSNLLVHADR
jgi:hypothetical protein